MSINALSASYATQPPTRSAQPVQAASSATHAAPAADSPTSATLSRDAQAMLDQLKARDTAVRQHEQAHLAASGGLATSAASYTYQRGPNGVNYAIGGEVHIDTSPGASPQETISRARIIQAAALAPADPSGQDRAVAAAARQMEAQARTELAQQQVQSAYGAGAATASALDTYA